MTSEGLSIWVIYDHPTDFPDRYVARRFQNDRPTAQFVEGATLDEVREKLPFGLAQFPRHPQDDPKIVETWF